MTLVYGALTFLAICVACGVLVAGLDALDRLHERRAKRKRSKRVDPMKLDERIAVLPDPVEQAYADPVGIALDVEPAPADDELPTVDERDVNGLVVEIYRHQIRAHFKSIYGEDGQP